MPASRADLLRPMPSLTDVRNRTPAADEELRCMSNHLVNKALLRPIEPGGPKRADAEPDSRHGSGAKQRTNYGPQRADVSAPPQRSSMVTTAQWFTLDNRRGPISRSRSREFKSRLASPTVKVLVKRPFGCQQ